MLSCVQLFATPWTVACHALLSMEFPRQEYWDGQRHLKFLRKLLSGKAWLAAHEQVYFSSRDKDCISHHPWQPGVVMWPFWANGSEWGCCSVFMLGLAHVIFPLLGNHHGRATKGRGLDPCIASWRTAAHPSGTPILTWWVRSNGIKPLSLGSLLLKCVITWILVLLHFLFWLCRIKYRGVNAYIQVFFGGWNSERKEMDHHRWLCLWRLAHHPCWWNHLYMRGWAFEVSQPRGSLASRWTKPQRQEKKKICKNDSGTQRHLSDIQLYLASSFRSKKEDAWL